MTDAGAPDYYPAFLNLKARLAVVVGNGPQVERKTKALLRHGADVAVISSDPPGVLIQAESEGLLTIERREFERGDLTGAHLVLCMHESDEVRQAVWADAQAFGCLINVAGAPEMSNFSIPSVMRRGPLQIAISTSGAAPVLAKRMRESLKEQYAEEWADYVTLFGEFRVLLAQRVPGGDAAHRPILEAVADSDVLDRIREGRAPDAEALFAEFVVPETIEMAAGPEADTLSESEPDAESGAE